MCPHMYCTEDLSVSKESGGGGGQRCVVQEVVGHQAAIQLM